MSLSEFSYYLRRYGPVALLGIILFTIFFIIIRLLVSSITNRPVPIVFTPEYGNIPPISFSQTVAYPTNPTFQIENIEGRALTATTSAQIFFSPSSTVRLGYARNISFMARAVGFDTEKERYTLEGNIAKYDNIQQSLDIDITNFNFSYILKFQNQSSLFEGNIIPDENTIKEGAKKLLNQMGKYPEELAQGTEHVIYLRYDPQADTFTVVDDLSLANVVEVDFFRPGMDGYPFVPPKYFNSQNFVVMIFKPEGNTIIKAQVKYFPINYDSGSYYPLKSGEQAWIELQQGQGNIVSPVQDTMTIIIREMYLGYYDPDEYQQYIQPVYVFLGDDNFAAYVSAIDGAYIDMGESSQNTQEGL